MFILKTRISAIAAASFAALVGSTIGAAAGECGNHHVYSFKYNEGMASNILPPEFKVTKGALCHSANGKAILYGVERDVPEKYIQTALEANRALHGTKELPNGLPVVEHQKSAAPVIAKKAPEPARVEVASFNPFEHVIRAVQAVQNFVVPQAVAAPVVPQAVAAQVVKPVAVPIAAPKAVAPKVLLASNKMAAPLALHPINHVHHVIRLAKHHIAKHASKFVSVPQPPAKPADLYGAKPVTTAPVVTHQEAPKATPRFAPRPLILMYEAHQTQSGPKAAKTFGEVKPSPNRAGSFGSYGVSGKARAQIYVPA